MINPVHRGDIRIDRVHNAAVCREIGERLVIDLGETPIGMPQHSMLLRSRLRDAPPKPEFDPLTSFLRATARQRRR
jgi:hypothetical protein